MPYFVFLFLLFRTKEILLSDPRDTWSTPTSCSLKGLASVPVPFSLSHSMLAWIHMFNTRVSRPVKSFRISTVLRKHSLPSVVNTSRARCGWFQSTKKLIESGRRGECSPTSSSVRRHRRDRCIHCS